MRSARELAKGRARAGSGLSPRAPLALVWAAAVARDDSSGLPPEHCDENKCCKEMSITTLNGETPAGSIARRLALGGKHDV
jgi:hypothetical protein